MSFFDLFEFTKNIVSSLGYFGVFLGTFMESIFPPIPSEVIMGFSGFLISEGRFQWIPTILAASAGNLLSVSLIWFLGRKYGKKFIVKFGFYVGVTEKEITLGEKLFAKYGYGIVFACQILPLARTLIAFPAGVLKTVYWKFALANTLGATIWMIFLAYLGFTFGNNWDKIQDFLKPFETLLLILVAIIGLFILYKFVQFLKRKPSSAGN